MYTKEERISCRSARNDKTSTTARSYFQGPKIRPRLPKTSIPSLSFSLTLSFHTHTTKPVRISMWWGNGIDCSLAAYGYNLKVHIENLSSFIRWKTKSSPVPTI